MTSTDSLVVSRFRDYLQGHDYSKRTCHNYPQWITHLAKHHDLKTVTPHAIDAWIFDKKAGSTVKQARYYAAVKFFWWAAKVRWRSPNPMRHIEAPRDLSERLPRPATIEAVRAGVRCHNQTLRVTVAVASYAGLRVGEIANLRWEHIDWTRGTIAVLRGKGNKDRVVPLSSNLAAILRELPVTRYGPVLQGRFGGKANANWLSTLVSEGMTDLGYPYTCHQFRHWFATEVYRLTKDLLLVQRLLGHASLKHVLNYVDLAGVDTSHAVAGLDASIDLDQLAA
jgi:integrase/recombinase XerD